MKVVQRPIFDLDPLRRLFLETLDEICDRDRPSEATEDMDVVLDSSDDQGRRIQISTGTYQVGMQFIPKRPVAQEWNAVFRREHDVHVDFGKGLRHGSRPLYNPFRVEDVLAPVPRVALRLPWASE